MEESIIKELGRFLKFQNKKFICLDNSITIYDVLSNRSINEIKITLFMNSIEISIQNNTVSFADYPKKLIQKSLSYKFLFKKPNIFTKKKSLSTLNLTEVLMRFTRATDDYQKILKNIKLEIDAYALNPQNFLKTFKIKNHYRYIWNFKWSNLALEINVNNVNDIFEVQSFVNVKDSLVLISRINKTQIVIEYYIKIEEHSELKFFNKIIVNCEEAKSKLLMVSKSTINDTLNL